MFCTKCGTGFDWNNSHIYEPGETYNPHQQEYAEALNSGKAKPLTDEDLPLIDGLSASDARLWHVISTEDPAILREFVSPGGAVNKDLVFIHMHVILHSRVRPVLESLEFVNEYSQKQRRLRMRFALVHGSNLTAASQQNESARAVEVFKSDLLRLEHKYRMSLPLYNIWSLFQSEVVRLLLTLYRS